MPRTELRPALARAIVLALALLASSGPRAAEHDGERSLEALQAEAQDGNPLAQSELARRLLVGEGVPQNYKEAARLFRAAAERDFSFAQDALAEMYRLGIGVPRDFAQAAHWYTLAANHGDAHSQLYLGLMSAAGEGGLRKSKAEAYFWFLLAAVENPEAVKFRDQIAKDLAPAQIDEAQRRAADWKRAPMNFMAPPKAATSPAG